jgi:hypothetical protein
MVNRCGHRPVTAGADGRLSLDDEACAKLFDWSQKGVCVPGQTVALDLLIKTIDPRVFDKTKYMDRCQRDWSAGSIGSYRSFRREVCEVGRARQ